MWDKQTELTIEKKINWGKEHSRLGTAAGNFGTSFYGRFFDELRMKFMRREHVDGGTHGGMTNAFGASNECHSRIESIKIGLPVKERMIQTIEIVNQKKLKRLWINWQLLQKEKKCYRECRIRGIRENCSTVSGGKWFYRSTAFEIAKFITHIKEEEKREKRNYGRKKEEIKKIKKKREKKFKKNENNCILFWMYWTKIFWHDWLTIWLINIKIVHPKWK